MYLGQTEILLTTWIDGILFQSIGPFSAATYGDTVTRAASLGVDLRIAYGLYFIPADQLSEWATPIAATETMMIGNILVRAIGLYDPATLYDLTVRAWNRGIEVWNIQYNNWVRADRYDEFMAFVLAPEPALEIIEATTPASEIIAAPAFVTAPIPAPETVTIPVMETFMVPGPEPATVALTDSALVAPSVVPIEPDIVASAPLTESPGLSIAGARLTLLVIAGLLLR